MRILSGLITLFSLFIVGCENVKEQDEEKDVQKELTRLEDVPEWSKNVIWYQIFVETFRNGDPSNDPTARDIAYGYPGIVPEDWSISDWGKDWFAPDPYFASLDGKNDWNGYPITEFHQKVQLRRYGGDLQGVMDKIDYIDSLGATAVFFNPLNDSPSKHKYDARNWRHIDRNFGPAPKADEAIMDAESPADPSTWKFTAADKLFLEIVNELHARGIKVIMDYSWNHTGADFWAIRDIQKNGVQSEYKDWYWVEEFDNPDTEENELHYKGWVGLKSLPEVKEDFEYESNIVSAYEGNIESSAAKEHIFNIAKRWLDPNGDGDTSDGVDGFRLDVAGEIGLGFWREYRNVVRSVNPDAYLVGEIWWKEWPDDLLDPEPFLKGDVFDAVMNYRWFRAVRHFMNQSPNKITAQEFVDSLNSFNSNLRNQNTLAMMNVAASHDVPRLSSAIFNKNKYKVGSNPNKEDGGIYKINKPDAEAFQTMKLLLIQQYTYLGSPHIWAGDEMGMWGGDDPNNRKPLIWPDIQFENEVVHPLGMDKPVDEVEFNGDLFQFYRKLINIRKANPVLALGNFEFLVIDDEKEVLAYRSFDESGEIITVFNTSQQSAEAGVPVKYSSYEDLLSGAKPNVKNGIATISLDPRSAVILKSE